MNSARQTRRILVLAAVLGAGWAVAVRILPRPELAETNYVANRLRIERWLLDPVSSNVLVGSSLSGRLLPAYFTNTLFGGWANLGLDGANPETGLTMVMNQPIPPAMVFLEVHRLSLRPGTNDAQLLELVRGPGLQLSRYAPLTRADWRPSTVLYGWLKSRQRGSGVIGAKIAAGATEVNSAIPDTNWVGRIEERLRKIQARGTKVCLIRLPVGRENPSDPSAPSVADEAAARLNLPLIDLYRLSQTNPEPITYSDGLHLSPRSAAVISRQLAEAAEDRFRSVR